MISAVVGAGLIISSGMIGLLRNIDSLSSTVAVQTRDIAALQTQAAAALDRAGTTRSDISAIQRDLIEIETQFCAEDAARNLMHAYDLRNIAILWRKVLDLEYQIGNAYYPQICRGNTPR